MYNFIGIPISNIQGINYCCIIDGIGKSDTINLLHNADLTKEEHYKNK